VEYPLGDGFFYTKLQDGGFMTFGKLVSIELTGGMTEEHQPVVTITAMAEDGRVFGGQLAPDIVRELGRKCFQVAESTENDVALSDWLQENFDLAINNVLQLVNQFRNAREENGYG
jgi:hypothetical protein